MGFARTAFALILPLLLLSGCNTTDALTPPVDVGGGRFPNSPPITDRDLQQMAETQQPVYPPPAASQPVYRQPAALPSASASGSDSRSYGLARPGPGAPPATLEQQAAGLDGGTRRAAAQPAEEAAPALPRRSAPAATAGTATAAAETEGTGAGTAEDRTIRFLPIIGAPLQAVTPLSRQLGAEARARGLVIRSSTDATARHVLKGYFSAVSGGGSITVTYVWDVLDNNGARLNRIQGQENFPGTASDPWSAVPASVMQNIAARTMDSYSQWRAGP